MNQSDRLGAAVAKICKEHGIPLAVGTAAFAKLVQAFDETQFKAHDHEGSLVNQVYRVLGDEAAYHLAGLLHRHDEGMALEELKYLDSTLKRFRTTIERWEFELRTELGDEA